MKSINSIFLSAVVTAVFLLNSYTVSAQSLKVNTDKSYVTWTASKVTGEHMGKAKLSSGEIVLTNGKLTGGKFVVDMNSISCDDITDVMSNEKLVNHLKSADFFGTASFPTATFTIKKVVFQGGETYKVTGDIVIKGKTKEVTTIAYLETDKGKVSGTAELKLDRSQFDIKYGSGSFFDNLGDNLIHDMFTVAITFYTL